MSLFPVELRAPRSDSPRMAHTKIVATIGPASEDRVGAMIERGLSVARLNFSYGSPAEHRRRVEKIRRAARQRMTAIGILADLPGPKIRVGSFPDEAIVLSVGQDVRVRPGDGVAPRGEVLVDVPDLLEAVRPGHRIVLADGQVLLIARELDGDAVVARVERAGVVGDRRGAHLPDSPVRYELPTAEDREWIRLARELEVDLIGVSFVARASEIEEIRGLAPGIGIVAKIERQAAYRNLDALVAAADGLMVARGDLGVELELEDLPVVQKDILARAVEGGCFTITATEMLESMVDHGRPTRAEVTDVANAVLDGTDAVMLSAETAVGRHPVEVVDTMARIARAAEASPGYAERPRRKAVAEHGHFTAATATAAVHVVDELGIERVVCFSETGNTVKMISQHRPRAEIIGLSPNPDAVRQMCVLAHVRPILFRREPTLEDMLETAVDLLHARRIVEADDHVVFVAGVPPGVARSTNVLKLHRIGEEVTLR